MSAPKRTVIPVDGSSHSEKAFDWYAKNLHVKGSEVFVLNVQEPPSIPTSPYPYGSAVLPSEWNTAVEKSIADNAKIIDYYNKKCHELGIKCRLYRGTGKPGESICQLAAEHDAYQIVMGSRGCGTVRRTLMGSVSDFCVHHSGVPVTVVPPDH